MEHQDWNSIKINTQAVKNKDTTTKTPVSLNKVKKVEKEECTTPSNT
jgi:hypothetical protein